MGRVNYPNPDYYPSDPRVVYTDQIPSNSVSTNLPASAPDDEFYISDNRPIEGWGHGLI